MITKHDNNIMNIIVIVTTSYDIKKNIESSGRIML